MTNDNSDREGVVKRNIEDILKGKTLQVYTYMIRKSEPVGVREVQRDLGFSSPSVANYHLEKLITLSLVAQDTFGRYFVTQKIQFGVLEAFINIGGRTIPRLLFFAVFFTTILFSYIITTHTNLNIHAVGFAVAPAIAFWFETVRMWRKKPY